MRDLPANQLNPKIKNVWRINDAIWLTVVFLCCFVPFAIAVAVESAGWMFVVLAALAALCVLAAQYPVLRLEWEARCAVEEEHPGRAERVWRGRVSGSGGSGRHGA